ncbi:MAG: biotin transporter BioY [Oscillospiraceae bacterium]|nr:biotin transporter BioY [Oscillospiraceae bacterium]
MAQNTHSMARTLDLAYIAAGTALLAVCSWICIPMTVQFTMQTFAVFFLLMLLGGKRGTASILVYILLGAAGVPVFSKFTGGLGVLFDKTGGYILGFMFTGLIYWAAERLSGGRLWVKIAALTAGLAVCYAFGTAWFMVVYTKAHGTTALNVVLGWCVYPFILPDLGKLVLAVLLARRVSPYLKTGKE